MTDKEIIQESSDVFFVDYLSMPEHARDRLTNRLLRDIFKHMVTPCLEKALLLKEEQKLRQQG